MNFLRIIKTREVRDVRSEIMK